MHKVIVNDKEFFCQDGENLLKFLLKNGIYIENPCNGKGTCKKCGAFLEKLSEDSDKENKTNFVLSCETEIEEDIRVTLEKENEGLSILTEGNLPNFEKNFRDGYGVSVDIGTTTIALDLVNLKNGDFISIGSVNPQKAYGLDVLTRISYEIENEDGKDNLHKKIIDEINRLTKILTDKWGIKQEDIVEFDISANTTMTHYLLGLEAKSLGVFPYKTKFDGTYSIRARELGLLSNENAKLYTAAHVSSFIGGDITSGLYVSGLYKSNKNALFLDIGTNGEMVLIKDGKMYGASAAAGPALEGMNISSGMRGENGAIEDLRISEDGLYLKVIGDKEPLGICGSGILSSISELVRCGFVKDSGAFIKLNDIDEDDYRRKYLRLDGNKREFVLDEEKNIFISQKDIRSVQLAKGAILSAFLSLLKESDTKLDDIDEVLIAGQFGSYLSRQALVGAGILPKLLEDRINYIGNSSKIGSYIMLMENGAREKIEKIASDVKHIELSLDENYEKLFSKCLLFKEVDLENV